MFPMRDQTTGDRAASTIVGAMLLLGMTVAFVPAAMELFGAIEEAADEHAMLARAQADEARAEREASERAAWCARHPAEPYPGPGSCPSPMPGYDCHTVPSEAVVTCVREEPPAGLS